MQVAGVVADIITYSAAISACEKGQQWQRAMDFLGQVRAAGMVLNVITYSAAISACEKGGQWDRALSLLDKLRKGGMTRTVISFSAAIARGTSTIGDAATKLARRASTARGPPGRASKAADWTGLA